MHSKVDATDILKHKLPEEQKGNSRILSTEPIQKETLVTETSIIGPNSTKESVSWI